MSPPVTAQSRPDYDEWGPDTSWNCDDWIAWHRALWAVYGAEEADRIWAEAWLDGLPKGFGGTGKAPGASFGGNAVPVDCRTFNAAFHDYVAARPKLYQAVYAGLGAVMAPIGGAGRLAREGGRLLREGGQFLNNAGELGSLLSFEALLGLGGLFWMLSRRRLD